MKNLLLIFLTSILFSGCGSLHGQNKVIEQFVKKVVETYNQKDSEKFNRLINKNTGLILITTLGPNNSWSKVQKICLDKKCLEKGMAESVGNPYQLFLEEYKTGNLNLNKVEFSEQSYFECDKITKQGIFIASENKFHTLSESVSLFIKHFQDIIGEKPDQKKKSELEKDRAEFKKIEFKSRRVTVNSKAGTFIFYMTYINGKWYLTIIDFASVDCSV
ncbi:hypothetical protein [Chryseobacterium gallinarum]|uniref:Lipoprotein n=1 Tax=Chryseobacterium gallinarum TaxID=1324352 RepID=A0A0G3M2S4_CHRGL|nr:hypothetical protein [Chryseobacterium gallinarum]AKK73481.1 hypothetical protein OK18_13500 [Chryseobacterium gallinarum]QIY90695.1 hypothetical protein FOB44_08440 [Chryseobacterium gallinarum]